MDNYEKIYKEALERARQIKNGENNWRYSDLTEIIPALEEVFPQLAESEDERIRKEISTLYADIDSCISELLAARTNKDAEAEGKALFRMEGLMVATLQDLSCVEDWLEKQKEQNPAKSIFPPGIGEVHFNPVSVVEQKSTQTTIFGQDYKCKKDYKEGNCWYVKDVIYHCNRDGYLIDQNGVSWSCSPEWFKEYILTNNEWAEKEKNDFVSGQFIQCVASFDLFKEDEYYWLEYVGNDTYIGRSDNVLNQKFHITPRQLFTRFSQHLEETTPLQETNIKPETLYLNNPSGEQIADALIHYLNEQNGILTAINCIKVQDIINWLNSKKEQNLADVAPNQFDGIIYGMQGCSTEKPAEKIRSDIIMAIRAFYKCEREDLVNYVKSLHIVKQEWSEEDSEMLDAMVDIVANSLYEPLCPRDKMLDWLKSLPERFNLQPKPEWSEEDEKIITALTKALIGSDSAEKIMLFDGVTIEMVSNFLKSLRPQPKRDCKDCAMFLNEKCTKPHWKPSEEQKYDGNMDKECIKLCDVLNSVPSIDTFESCCGHLKDRYSIWFFCNDIITISRLGRCVERNYSDGKWELLVDPTDTHPTGVFWLRSKVPFQSYDEMEKSINELCSHIQYWFNAKFDSYFNCDIVKQELHWKPSEEQMEAFRSYIKDFQEKAEAAVGGWNNFDIMIQLFEQLNKLMQKG